MRPGEPKVAAVNLDFGIAFAWLASCAGWRDDPITNRPQGQGWDWRLQGQIYCERWCID
jgi:hypothetical protein